MAGVWQAVLQATSPRDIVDRKVPGVEAMQAARDEVTGEVNKNARMPPKFSADGGCSLWPYCSPALTSHPPWLHNSKLAFLILHCI